MANVPPHVGCNKTVSTYLYNVLKQLAHNFNMELYFHHKIEWDLTNGPLELLDTQV